MKEVSSNSYVFSLDDLLHPRIIDNCISLFRDKHYRPAAHEAMIQVEQALHEKGLYDKSLFGRKLIKYAFGDKAPINLEVPLGKKFQEQAKTYFESVFSYYRNYTAHEKSPINSIVCLRILVIASELLDLISASSIPFKGVETIDALVDGKLFQSRDEFYKLLRFLNGQQFPGEVFDGFFEELAENDFSNKQYSLMFELDLVVYKNTDWQEESPMGDIIEDKYGWFEVTPLGKILLQECGNKEK
jgi:uncharacterized protein (TIGR02391 family)